MRGQEARTSSRLNFDRAFEEFAGVVEDGKLRLHTRFEVQLANGAVELEPNVMVWGSRVLQRKKAWPRDEQREAITAGSRVLVPGRASRDDTGGRVLLTNGLVFATPAAVNPRQVLAALLTAHLGLSIAAYACAAVAIAVAITANLG